AEVRLPAVDAIVLSDYAKGVLTPALLKQLIAMGRGRGLPVVVDPKGADYSSYAGATVITPNRKELELVAGFPVQSRDDLVRAGRRLRESLVLDAVLVTQGAEGYTLILEEEAVQQPARTPREVFDVSGAGDTVAAVMALGLAGGWDIALAAALANLAAGVVVTKKGTAPILLSEMQAELHGHVHLQEKMTTLAELRLLVPHLQAQGKKVVFTNGCFDLLHRGHIRFLEAARQLGDVLVVAVDSDDSVRQVKGEGRPIIGEEDRRRILAALSAVDYVSVFTSDQLPELLAAIRPDILVKGSNYPEEQVAGREIITSYGGRVALVPVTDPVSVSEMIQRIRGEEG
ncbi:MAG: PfkB family carbohydrate kinase, partial [Desulfobaccales bacterium]